MKGAYRMSWKASWLDLQDPGLSIDSLLLTPLPLGLLTCWELAQRQHPGYFGCKKHCARSALPPQNMP